MRWREGGRGDVWLLRNGPRNRKEGKRERERVVFGGEGVKGGSVEGVAVTSFEGGHRLNRYIV